MLVQSDWGRVSFPISLSGAATTGGGREMCVVILGTLTRVAQTAEHNLASIDKLAELTGATVSYHFVGGAEIATSRRERTYTQPKDDSSVEATLGAVFPGRKFTTSVVPQDRYESLWPKQKQRLDGCWKNLAGSSRWGDTKFFPINSRQSLTLSTLGEVMSGEGSRCGWVVGYRSDFRFGGNFPQTAAQYMFNPEHQGAWINRAFHQLVSRTDVFVASRQTVAKLRGFDDYIWFGGEVGITGITGRG